MLMVKAITPADLTNYGNLFANCETLKGLKIRLENGVHRSRVHKPYSDPTGYILSNGRVSAGQLARGDNASGYINAIQTLMVLSPGTGGYTLRMAFLLLQPM